MFSFSFGVGGSHISHGTFGCGSAQYIALGVERGQRFFGGTCDEVLVWDAGIAPGDSPLHLGVERGCL